jgi:hypothetical protein
MFLTLNEPLESQTQELKNLLGVDVIAFRLTYNPTDTVLIEANFFLNSFFQKFIQNEVGYLSFCVDFPNQTLFHIKGEKIYFLVFDFNDNFKRYTHNKFMFFYDENF